MAKKIFWSDPYCTQLLAQVSKVSGAEIQLDATIFFAFSGGQESDHGTIGGLPVIAARKQERGIIYTLPDDHGFYVGQQVLIEIDWVRRYRLMRLHFAAELVLELFYQTLNGVDKVGAHIAQNKARIDFAWPQSIAPLLPEITQKANQIIADNVPIHTGYDDEENERRYWEIEGFSRVPCGGTHVRSTGEIGPLRLKRENKAKGKERVEIYLLNE
ncbi:alanyl-tRNA editing protein [Undibacterium sp. SXout11W]|uniref:alanyl-tRNA editing protein n=1 Tax=Undibacterium sp. SXout11W TaxID=3413050 RepID=UPI003BEF8B07